MKPPEAPEDGNASTGTAPPAVSVCPPVPLTGLRKRADFLRAARALLQAAPGLVLQARQRGPDDPPAPLIRVGITATKKVGNAVARNRAKRRLRAIARTTLPTHGQPGWDYVLIARPGVTATRPFADLVQDLTRALEKIHTPR